MPTLTLTATKDNYLYSGGVNQANGLSGSLGLSYDGYRMYPIINFDFSTLPANAYINSATLKLYAVTSPSLSSVGAKLPVSLTAIRDFNETTSTYDNSYSQVQSVADPASTSVTITVPSSGTWLNLDVTAMMKRRISFEGFMLSYYQNGIGYTQSFASRQNNGGLSIAPQLVIDYSIGSLVTQNVFFSSDYTINEGNAIESTTAPTVNIGANTHHYTSDGGYDEEYIKFGMLFWDMNVLPANAQFKSATLNAKTSSYGAQRRLASVSAYLYQYNGSNEANPVGLLAQGAFISSAPWGSTSTETWFTYPLSTLWFYRQNSIGYFGMYLRPTPEARDVWVISDFYSRNSGNPPYIAVTYVIPNQPPAAPVITYPPNNTWINIRTPIVQWIFSDPDPGDYQSQYWIQLVNAPYNAVLQDTGWLSGNVRSWQMPSGWITADGNYYLRIMVRDSSGTNSLPGTGTPGDTTFYNVYFGVDTVSPNQPTLSIGTVTGTTIATTFSLFSDAAPSSGIAPSGLFVVVDDMAGNRVATHQPPVGSTSFLIPNLTPNTSYRIWVTYLDAAGNWSPGSTTYTVVTDTRAPDAPTQTNGILYATTNSVSWSSFSDGPVSSGLLLTMLYLQKWNGNTFVTESGYPKSVVGLSNTISGLTPATQYRWGITYTDNVGNVSPLAYTNFTTNTYAVTTIENVVAGGKVYNDRPKIRMKVIDANDATLTDLEVQRSPIPPFTSPTSDVTISGSPQSYNVTAPFASGTLVTYTPASALPAGISYIRARANDGKDWGTWSAVTNLTIETPTYQTTIAANDTTISRRTIDDIRAKVNIVRQARGLAVIVWTDSTIKDWTNGAASTDIRGIHLIELRQAINDIYVALGVSAPTWGVDPIIDTTINRKGQHWIDLRNALALA